MKRMSIGNFWRTGINNLYNQTTSLFPIGDASLGSDEPGKIFKQAHFQNVFIHDNNVESSSGYGLGISADGKLVKTMLAPEEWDNDQESALDSDFLAGCQMIDIGSDDYIVLLKRPAIHSEDIEEGIPVDTDGGDGEDAGKEEVAGYAGIDEENELHTLYVLDKNTLTLVNPDTNNYILGDLDNFTYYTYNQVVYLFRTFEEVVDETVRGVMLFKIRVNTSGNITVYSSLHIDNSIEIISTIGMCVGPNPNNSQVLAVVSCRNNLDYSFLIYNVTNNITPLSSMVPRFASGHVYFEDKYLYIINNDNNKIEIYEIPSDYVFDEPLATFSNNYEGLLIPTSSSSQVAVSMVNVSGIQTIVRLGSKFFSNPYIPLTEGTGGISVNAIPEDDSKIRVYVEVQQKPVIGNYLFAYTNIGTIITMNNKGANCYAPIVLNRFALLPLMDCQIIMDQSYNLCVLGNNGTDKSPDWKLYRWKNKYVSNSDK